MAIKDYTYDANDYTMVQLVRQLARHILRFFKVSSMPCARIFM